MVRRPNVLLLDKPFEKLDEMLKQRVRAEIGLLQCGYGVTTLMTSNDPHDAVSLPARLAVIDDGRLVQVGTWEEVRRSPATLNAAMSTGTFSTLPVRVAADGGVFWLVREHPAGGVRPEDVALDGPMICSTRTKFIPATPTMSRAVESW
jgi:ABC-type sugar transport system ATPase subunit